MPDDTSEGRGVRRDVIRRTITDSSPQEILQLRQASKAIRWETNHRVLEITELLAGHEHAWRCARSQLLKLFNDEQKLMRSVFERFGVETEADGAAEVG